MPQSTELVYNFTLSRQGTLPAHVLLGEHIALIIQADAGISASPPICADILRVFDDIYRKYTSLAGALSQKENAYLGRAVIQVPADNAGAAGLAGHGVAGISVGAGLVRPLFQRWPRQRSVDHVFFYEFGRNFWHPRYNRKLDWICGDDESCWGWWTVGMCNAFAIIIPTLMRLRMNYFGSDCTSFRNRMVVELAAYLSYAKTSSDPFQAWRTPLMPWHPTESVNDLMTGFLVRSFEQFGGEIWLQRFFYELDHAVDINPSVAGGRNYQHARDNIYKIWSGAARADLHTVFAHELRWQISSTAQQQVSQRFPAPNHFSLNL